MLSNCISKLTDEDLVRLYLKGDDSSGAELYLRYFPKIQRRCNHLLKDSDLSVDLTQDIFIKILNALAQFNHQAKFGTWVYRITQNSCYEYLRNTRSITTIKLNKHFDMSDLEANTSQSELEDALLLLVENLADADKELLKLKYVENLSISKIEASMHLSASAIKMRLQRLRFRLFTNLHQIKNQID